MALPFLCPLSDSFLAAGTTTPLHHSSLGIGGGSVSKSFSLLRLINPAGWIRGLNLDS
jgi:hypothetical protein